MSQTKFFGYRTPYDEDQSRERYLEYLRVAGRTSALKQGAERDALSGVVPSKPTEKTTSEILGDEAEMFRILQGRLAQILQKADGRPRTPNESDDFYEQRTNPIGYVLARIQQPEAKLLITSFDAILADLKGTAGNMLPADFLTYIDAYETANRESGGVSKFNQQTRILTELQGLRQDVAKSQDIAGLQTSVNDFMQKIRSERGIETRQRAMLTRDLETINARLSALQAVTRAIDYDRIAQIVEMGTENVMEGQRQGTNQILQAQRQSDISNISAIDTLLKNQTEIGKMQDALMKNMNRIELSDLGAIDKVMSVQQDILRKIAEIDATEDVARIAQLQDSILRGQEDTDNLIRTEAEKAKTRQRVLTASIKERINTKQEELIELMGEVRRESGEEVQSLRLLGENIRTDISLLPDRVGTNLKLNQEDIFRQIFDKIETLPTADDLTALESTMDAMLTSQTLDYDKADAVIQSALDLTSTIDAGKIRDIENLLGTIDEKASTILDITQRRRTTESEKDISKRIKIELGLVDRNGDPKSRLSAEEKVRFDQAVAQELGMPQAQEVRDASLRDIREAMTPIARAEPISTAQPKGVIIEEGGEEREGVGIRKQAYLARNKVQPKFSQIVGRGVKLPTNTTRYKEFGTYAISEPQLSKGILSLKYISTGRNVQTIPSTKITEDFADFLDEFLETAHLDKKRLDKLPANEKRLFAKLINGSGLYGKYKVRLMKSKEEEEEEQRFNLVKGIYIAGNDNPQVVKELKQFIIKFMADGRIPRKEGQDLLLQLSL